jgi:NADP-dependent 3-hydroxy acid dehydrogenase YdfG
MTTTPFRAQATALITGAASGVGFSTAKLCRQKFGMHVVLIDRDSDSLQKAAEALDDSNESLKIEVFDMDVSNTSAWEQVARSVKESLGGVDFLMLNAGTSHKAQGEDNDKLKTWKDLDYWNKVMDINSSSCCRVKSFNLEFGYTNIETDIQYQYPRTGQWPCSNSSTYNLLVGQIA